MHGHSSQSSPTGDSVITLVGNPNVGKSVIFGYLTGRYVTVSNYPGTTVEISNGKLTGDNSVWDIVDTPGTNNLIPSSEDEQVTRDLLIQQQAPKVVQVIDSKNLSRGLLLSLQLSEMGIPYLVCLNMADEARDRGIVVDGLIIENELGIPVRDTVATQKIGLDWVIKRLSSHLDKPKAVHIEYPPAIEQAATHLSALLPDLSIEKRALALMVLAGDQTLDHFLMERLAPDDMAHLKATVFNTSRQFRRSLNQEITAARMKAAHRIRSLATRKLETRQSKWISRIDKATIHPIQGLGVVAGVLAAMYYFVGVLGAGTMVDFFENTLFGEHIVPWLTTAVNTVIPWAIVQDLLIGEFGLLSMALSYSFAIILPIVGTFFLAFGVLEDSGYLPRLSVMLNRAFKAMGLNGKAVLPMVLGLGCDTMATMTTRMLDSRKERLVVTLLLALGVPCSAQLGVILAMLQGISIAAAMIWAVLIMAVIFFVGYLASKVIPGQKSDFVLELPPLRVPGLGNIVVKTLARLEWYLREAVPLFFLGTLVLFALDQLELLSAIERFAAPVVQTFLGLPAAATAAFIMGFLRRDYGAAGLYALAINGLLDPIQVLVSLVVITLFMPCIANFFMIIKEYGWRITLAMTAFILPFALLVGGLLNWTLRSLQVTF